MRGHVTDLVLAGRGSLGPLGGVERLGDRALQAGQRLAGPLGVDVAREELQEWRLGAGQDRAIAASPIRAGIVRRRL